MTNSEDTGLGKRKEEKKTKPDRSEGQKRPALATERDQKQASKENPQKLRGLEGKGLWQKKEEKKKKKNLNTRF